MNNPNLKIFWYEDNEYHEIGPFFTASPDGIDVTGHKFKCYEVQDQDKEFRRVTVPWYHGLKAIIYT